METLAPFKEVIDEIKECGGRAVTNCFQCGKCDTVCPWNEVSNFSVRKVIREATFGLSEVEKEEIWKCTTCGRCPVICPRDVKQIEDMVALRRIATKYGIFPGPVKPIRSIVQGLQWQGNPFNEERQKRNEWASGLSVKEHNDKTEYLYFTCCYLSYDPRLKRVARSVVNILNKAKIDFGILGQRENCCGESIKRSGNEDLFIRLAKENIKAFVDSGVKRIIVSSPHCYHTFKNEYPELKVNFEVLHLSEVAYELLLNGRLKIKKEYKKRVVYHDPCYLGRHNGIFDEPREILKSIPGLELVELKDSREDSLCCGMGGGRVWMETPKEERFSNLRIEEAAKIEAQELVTSCPYCITAFEDSRLVMNLSDRIEVKDIAEILDEVI
ncbi:MAG: (Fe-S)-binding protein [Desulfobacterota bacterium]|nr:(Fe-S)-binding protein [Thermodesulfobacteriota bacterium]